MKQRSLIVVTVIGGLLAFGPLAGAQQKRAAKSEAKPSASEGQRPPTARERLAKMEEDLKLTDTQKEKFRAALQAERKKSQEVRQDSNLSRQEKTAKAKPIREETEKKIKEILKPEQYEQWQKMRQETRQRGQGGGRGARGNAKP